MMLRGNLASKPFYNERLVSLALLVLLVIVVALTAINAVRLTALSSRRSALRAEISAGEAQAARTREGAQAVQRSVDRAALMSLAGSTKIANDLIAARTFSWTTLFGYIEDTIPFDVRLTAVTPDTKDGDMTVVLLLLGRSESDIETFARGLEATGAFYDVIYTVADTTEDGLKRVTLTAGYLPPKVLAPTGSPEGPGGRP